MRTSRLQPTQSSSEVKRHLPDNESDNMETVPAIAVCLQWGSIGDSRQAALWSYWLELTRRLYRGKPTKRPRTKRRQSPFIATRRLPVRAQYERGNTKDARSSRKVEHVKSSQRWLFFLTSVKTRKGNGKRIERHEPQARPLQQFVAVELPYFMGY